MQEILTYVPSGGCAHFAVSNRRYIDAMGAVKTSPFSVPGTYKIQYAMVDEQGNRGSKTRTLVVVSDASSSSGLSPGGVAGVTIAFILLIALAASF